jgi:AcrR family transcriptional regulator
MARGTVSGAGARARAAAATRAAVLQAARTVLGDPDPEGWSMETVAAAAGVTRMTVYNQFGARSALIEAVLDEVVSRDGMDRLVGATHELPPTVALERALLTTCRFWRAERPLLRRLFATSYTEPALAELLDRREGWRREQLGALVGRIDARHGDDQDLLDLLVVATSFPTYDRLSGNHRSPQEVAELVTRLVDALLHAS